MIENFRSLQARLVEALNLSTAPVAISFHDALPAGVPKLQGSQPSGCSFWRLAAQGGKFYTVPSDHYNCPIGCYTHNISLPKEREHELMGTVSLMVQIGYLKEEEVPGIARLAKSPDFTGYSPLAETTDTPDVVLIVGRPGKLMLLQEAALRAGVGSDNSLMARPTCMAIPVAMTKGVAASTGCIGNRVYTDLSDDELYVAIPGAALGKLADALDTIVAANAQLATYHQQRKQQLTAQ